MIYALQATLSFTTTNRRNNVVAATNTRIQNKPRWGDTTVAPGTETAAPFTAAVEVRFDNEADLDDAYAFLQTASTQQQGSGRIARHVCAHDEDPPGACSIEAQVGL